MADPSFLAAFFCHIWKGFYDKESCGYTKRVHNSLTGGFFEGQTVTFFPSGEAEQPRPHDRRKRKTPPPCLFLHRSSLIFSIPAELQPCLAKTEYRRSIGRCYAQEAKLRDNLLDGEIFTTLKEAEIVMKAGGRITTQGVRIARLEADRPRR